jgi:RND superfamily putative drug exporter
MTVLPSTATLARVCARHPLRTLGLWIVVMLLAGVAGSGLQDRLTTEGAFTNTPESVRAADLLESRLRGSAPVSETVIVRSEAATIEDPAFRSVVEQTTAALLARSDMVTSVVNVYQAQAADPAVAATMVSADRHTALIAVTLVGKLEDAHDYADDYLQILELQKTSGFTILTAGDLSSSHAFSQIAESDLQSAEVFGLPIAMLVLVVIFGALLAAGVPLIVALVSIFIALGMAALLGRAFDLSFYVVNMITMMGLAVGIDYTLFILQRYREERQAGHPTIDAITLAGDSASKAVLFSGITVVLALSGMILLPINIFRSLGTGAVLVVIVTISASLTLVPAMLALLGDRVDQRCWQLFRQLIGWPRRSADQRARGGTRVARLTRSLLILPLAALLVAVAAAEFVLLDLLVSAPARLRRRRSESSAASSATRRGFWERLSQAVMARPLVSAGLTLVILVTVALPYVNLETGAGGAETLPASDVKTAVTILEREFYVGRLTPVEIVIDGPVADQDVQARASDLLAAMRANPLFGPASVTANAAGDLTLVAVPLKSDANASASYAAVRWLRGELLPQLYTGTPATAYVGGATAMNMDFKAAIDTWTPRIFAFVLSLSFLLLLVAFRSLVVPLKAIIMNLLSVGASYGLLVLVFQEGFGNDLLGLQQTPTIEPWVPIFLFCVLFGLSMDYHVFLLSRIRERFDETRNNREAVATGLQQTGRIITGAALIMVVVFGAFASGNLVMFQQMGFGQAVAILLDATLVRSVLVPATMALLGDWNWWIPRVLDRVLPKMALERAGAAGATS